MAVTSIWPVKSRLDHVIDYIRNPEKTTIQSAAFMAAFHQIDSVVEYAADDMKTEQRELVSCINCQEESAVAQFVETKKQYLKLNGRLCYNGYQSFAAGEVDAETAHKIGVELAKRMWGDRFEVVVATHCNTDHFHNHFVVNSVSFVDGLKFDNNGKDYHRFRELSDQLCREYRLSVIREPKRKGLSYAQWEAEKEGLPTRRSMICDDIDRAVRASTTISQFKSVLTQMGYQLKLYKANGEPLKCPAINPPGTNRYFRFRNLGDGFSWDEIIQRVYENAHGTIPFPEAEQRSKLPNVFVPYPKATGLRALYLKYCYELHIIVRHPTSTKRVPFSCREDIRKLEQLDIQSRFLALHGIDTVEQLMDYRSEIQTLLSDTPNISPNEKKSLRREVRLCDAIRERSKEVEANLQLLTQEQEIEQTEQEIQRKEEMEHEQFGRSSGSGDPNVFEWG